VGLGLDTFVGTFVDALWWWGLRPGACVAGLWVGAVRAQSVVAVSLVCAATMLDECFCNGTAHAIKSCLLTAFPHVKGPLPLWKC
jgi:hypothetical protein